VHADIIFCLPVLQKEAKEQGKTLKAHLAHLIVHGCLHAQSYDHESKKDAQKMEALEVQILKRLGFPNPYLDNPIDH
jgi:probable rRNA maturation factor